MNQRALSEYFNSQAGVRSNLGGLDCVRFVIEALEAGWGIDCRDVLGYHDRRSAVDRLRIAGGLEAAFTAELGEPMPPAELRPGDIAYFIDPAVGLVMPGYIAVKLRGSVGRIPLQFADKGWRLWGPY